MSHKCKYKAGDIVVYFGVLINIKLVDFPKYGIEYINHINTQYSAIDSNFLDLNSELELKYSRKEKIKKLNETSTMVK